MDIQEDASTMDESRLRQLAIAVGRRAPLDAVTLIDRESDEVISNVLERLDITMALRILSCLSSQRQESLTTLLASRLGDQMEQNLSFPEGSIARLMEPVSAQFPSTEPVADVIEAIRPLAQDKQIVYVFVVDDGQLVGVVAMRELLFAGPDDLLKDVMITEPFYLLAEATHEDAMRAMLRRHYPVYPVCDGNGVLLGLVRGYTLFEQQTYELTAQAGRMVGIEKEERLNTPWLKSLMFRHPWLQLNLLTAFVAGAVVGVFEDTIQQVVALAAFLPVLAGQSGNTGCQALAITLRSMTLNELKPGMEAGLLRKEALLGLCNGILVGCTAGAAMLAYAMLNGSAEPWLLAIVIVIAMLGSCVVSGIAGVLIPLFLRRLGTDPATASTIFLTTATDVVSMGAMLGLATILML